MPDRKVIIETRTGQRVRIDIEVDSNTGAGVQPITGVSGEIPAGSNGTAFSAGSNGSNGNGGGIRFYPAPLLPSQIQGVQNARRNIIERLGLPLRQDAWFGAHQFKRRYIPVRKQGALTVFDLGARLVTGSYEDLDLSSLTDPYVTSDRLTALLGSSPLGTTGSGSSAQSNSPQLPNDDAYTQVKLIKNPSTGVYSLVAPQTMFYYGFDTSSSALKVTSTASYDAAAVALPALNDKSKIRAFLVPMICDWMPSFYTWHHYTANYRRYDPSNAGTQPYTPYPLAGDYPDTDGTGGSFGPQFPASPVENSKLYDRLPPANGLTRRSNKLLATRAFVRALSNRIASKVAFTLPNYWSNPTPFTTNRLAPVQMFIKVDGVDYQYTSTDLIAPPNNSPSGLAVSYKSRDTGQLRINYQGGSFASELAGIIEVNGTAYYLWRNVTDIYTAAAITADRHQAIPQTPVRRASYLSPQTLPAINSDDAVDFVPLSIVGQELTPVGIYLGDDASTQFTVDSYPQTRTFTDSTKEAPPYVYVPEDYQP